MTEATPITRGAHGFSGPVLEFLSLTPYSK